DLAGCAERRFFEREIQIVSQIGAALDAAAAAPAAAERIAKTENVAESVAEVGKDTGIKAAACGSRNARVSEPVVVRPLLRVTQHRVCFSSLFELFFRFVIRRISIRMKLKRQFSIRAFDFLLAGVARDAKNLVIIPFS